MDLALKGQTLVESLAFTKAIVDTVRDPILVLDGGICIKMANRAFHARFRTTPEELHDRPLFEVSGGQWNLASLRELLENVLARQSSFDDFELDQEFGTLGRRVMLLNGRRLEPTGGSSPLILLAIEDVTNRRASEHALAEHARKLEETEQRLRKERNLLGSILNSMSEGVAVANEKMEYVLFNPAAGRILGIADTAVPTREWPVVNGTYRSDGVTPLPAEEVPLTRAMRGESVDEAELFIRHPGLPEGRYLSVNARPLSDKGGLVVIRDVTQHRKLEHELAERMKDLERSNAELEQFAYVASHDLQEPLRMVASYTQLLGRRYKGRLDPDADDFIAYAVDGALRMQALINDLLAYSRVGSKGAPLETISLQTVLGRALENLGSAIQESGAEITHDLLPDVLADSSQLVQVFQNLVGNAIKFRGAEPPRIRVGASQTATEHVLSVRDNGIGIDPAYFGRLFIIFQRLHSKTDYPGTGIGLAVCKRIVERHRGRIWVESQAGQGTTFFFTIRKLGGVR